MKIQESNNILYTADASLLKEHATPNTIEVSHENPYLNIDWKQLDDGQTSLLLTAPTTKEILFRLKKAKNNSPGPYKLEYLHLKLIDKNGLLLESIFEAVYRNGIPTSWKESRTILIHKKGDTHIPSNFRPISLLNIMYKLYSGILSSKIVLIATSNDWISKEQKGFLPGIRGIQEHTYVLESAIQESKKNKDDLFITWLDLSNAFGSITHSKLFQLFDSLPIPLDTKRILNDIYTDTKCIYDLFSVMPSAGVKQGDSLSPIISNLASEPIIRSAKQYDGIHLFGSKKVVTTYADDSAIMKIYLGIPIGMKFLFRTAKELGPKLNLIADSSLAPWQKIEVLRSHLLPSLSHDLSSGRVDKCFLDEIDKKVMNFLRLVSNTPDNAAIPFFHANRSIGGLGIAQLNQETDIWTIAKACQLLSSSDPDISKLAMTQLKETIRSAGNESNLIPPSDFISGKSTNGLLLTDTTVKARISGLERGMLHAGQN